MSKSNLIKGQTGDWEMVIGLEILCFGIRSKLIDQ